jgi:DNA excision repair protein ERCC-4
MNPDTPPGQQGRRLLEDRLRLYLYWKSRLATRPAETRPTSTTIHEDPSGVDELSPALRKKDRERAERAASRRRIRGGAPGTVNALAQRQDQISALPRDEEGVLAELYAHSSESSRKQRLTSLSLATQDNTSSDAELALALSLEASLPPDEAEFEPTYGLLVPSQTVIVRAYADDSDDRMLAELQPRFIVMYEPNQDFVRRIEVCPCAKLTHVMNNLAMQVYKASNPGLAVRVYFMVYQTTAEEHKYLASLRKEKDAFERLIRERGVSVQLPAYGGDSKTLVDNAAPHS